MTAQAIKQHHTLTKPAVDAARTQRLLSVASAEGQHVLDEMSTSTNGLSSSEAQARLAQYGKNETARARKKTWFTRLIGNLKNPLVILLSVLAIISTFTGDVHGAFIMLAMILLGVFLRYFQESNADQAAERLKALVSTQARVRREGAEQELPLSTIVPGDILVLSAGDVVPADARVLAGKDLFVNQSALTGESLPAEKSACADTTAKDPLECPDLIFQGTHVETGTATAVALLTGGKTYFGALAASALEEQGQTAFEVGINKFTWLMISFIAVMVPAVFLINGFAKGNWLEAFMFALAVGVGLTPEMLPAIVTVNLSKGAIAMARKKVIIKHLDSIQNLGAMDVVCMDKTGTLTQGIVILEKHIDILGNQSPRVLDFAFLNSYYQTGLKNMMDMAVLNHEDMQSATHLREQYQKIDEIPFDFIRRRMSVIVRSDQGDEWMICKGAVEEVMELCNQYDQSEATLVLNREKREAAHQLARELNEDGFRVLALAIKKLDKEQHIYEPADELDLTLLGLLAFLDPPKETASKALEQLNTLGIRAMVLTGDNDVVTRKICKQVGLESPCVLLGSEIERMSDVELDAIVSSNSIFAKLSPASKARIIVSLQRKNHVVGFLGDGINDAPALRAADVGISVDSAVDIAKESSDIILLEKSLLVLSDGIVSGRTVFCNVIKYVKMAASSNFGNMLSVVGASIFLPFLPMLPLQILTNNLLYDISQTSIPTDSVDPEWLTQPRKWAIGDIKRFIVAIGPVSSIFDYLTFFTMLYVFNCWHNEPLFHTGWFVESLLTQTLIIHVIRTDKIPFIQSRASLPLTVATTLVAGFGMMLPFTPLGKTLGFVALPPLYWSIVLAMLITYVILTQIVKAKFVRVLPK